MRRVKTLREYTTHHDFSSQLGLGQNFHGTPPSLKPTLFVSFRIPLLCILVMA